MNGSRGVKVVKLIGMGVVAVVVFGFVVMGLWNWLIPGLTGWHALGFAQALGLLVLCRILFGGFGRGGFMRERMRARFERMTPEERERFRARFGGHCRRGAAPEGTAEA
jgi:hypothetical protein